jgi:NAD(P)-dependent dehydrogenase (short-subunit alcohol dehydrogenase family)
LIEFFTGQRPTAKVTMFLETAALNYAIPPVDLSADDQFKLELLVFRPTIGLIKDSAACSVYNASKAAVRAFACTWIVDLKERDIRVNVLSAGYTDAPGIAQFMTDDDKAADGGPAEI